MIEDIIRPTATNTTPIWRTLVLALVVLCGVALVGLSSGPLAEAATTFTVNSIEDDGDIEISDSTCDSDPAAGEQCTLRAAIEEANDTAGDDTIDFDIVDGTNPAKTIYPDSPLPPITDTLTIDGYTQQGASPNTLAEGNDALLNVQLDGLNAEGTGVTGLVIEAADTTIKGLVIRRFDEDGVQIIGAGATGNRVEGNFIGVNRDGITDRGNSIGVYFNDGDDNTVGGTQPEMRNVISGNDQSGVFIVEASGNRVEGNYIGTTADGDADLGNAELGVTVVNADNTTVGGTVAGARNVISGNDQSGILINGSEATENRIEGNYIGTTAAGTADLGNTQDGVAVESADNTTVGGTAEGARNVISGNGQSGVFVGFEASDNKIEGNYIGTTADKTGDLGNTEHGVSIHESANFTAVGGTLSGASNRIAHNGGDGVSVAGSNSSGNNILSNRIYHNAELGIDLVGFTEGANGVTNNDTGDPDTGANNLQNFPVITSAIRSNTTGDTTISGRLNSNPSQDFVIQCFLTNGAPATAHGEGSRLLDTEVVSTNATGNRRFTCLSSLPILGQIPGQTVSATATNILTTGDTSEFSRNRAITTVP